MAFVAIGAGAGALGAAGMGAGSQPVDSSVTASKAIAPKQRWADVKNMSVSV